MTESAKTVGIADRVLMSAAGFSALSIPYALWRIVSLPARTPQDAFSFISYNRTALFSMYAVTQLLASGLLYASLKLRPSMRVNLALALASSMIALLAADVLVAPWLPSGPSRLAVIQDLQRRGINARPALMAYVIVKGPVLGAGPSPSVDVEGRPTLPLAGVSRCVSVDCKEGRDWLIYESDEHGFHNPPGLWEAAPIDIVAVGDSFTLGSCVPSDQNMVARVRERYPLTVNLGCSGNGPLMMLAGLREYMPHLRPKVVLWCYFSGNDLLDLEFESHHALLVRYLEDGFSQGLLARQAALDRALDRYIGEALPDFLRRNRSSPVRVVVDTLLLRHLRSRLLLGAQELLAPGRGYPDFMTPEENYQLFERILVAARTMAQAQGSALYFVYLPARAELFGRKESRDLAEARRRRVLALVRDMGLPLIDVREEFESHGGPELFVCERCHYSPEGYQRAAQKVLGVLKSEARLSR